MCLGDWALSKIVTRMMVSHQKMSKSDMWAWGGRGLEPLPPRCCRDPSSLGEHLSRLRIQACVPDPLLGLRGQGWQAEWSARGGELSAGFPPASCPPTSKVLGPIRRDAFDVPGSSARP